MLIKAQVQCTCMESCSVAKAKQKKQYKNAIKINLHLCKITPKELRSVLPTNYVDVSLSTKPLQTLKKPGQIINIQREQCHNSTLALVTTTVVQCPYCSRLCKYRLSLGSHLQIHWWIARQSLLQTQRTAMMNWNNLSIYSSNLNIINFVSPLKKIQYGTRKSCHYWIIWNDHKDCW